MKNSIYAKSMVVLSVKVIVSIAAIISLFIQDLIVIFNDALMVESNSHILLIPIIFVLLVYRKRKVLRSAILTEDMDESEAIRYMPLFCGILLSTIAILLYWYGSYTFTPLEYHMFALPVFATGLILILFNPQTLRQLAFPVAFLVFLMPPPSEILYALGSTLSTLSTEIPNAIVNALGIPSAIVSEYGNPTIVITRPDGTPLEFTVDIACSGIYSLIGFIIFAVFVAYIIRDKIWKKLAVILLGIPLIYSLNITRITVILMLGYYHGGELAIQAFHLMGGWVLLFLGTILLLEISEKILKTQIFAGVRSKCQTCNSKPEIEEAFCPECGRILKPPDITISKYDVAKIAAIIIAVTLLTLIQAPVFALTKTNPIILTSTPSGQQASTEILPQIPDYNLIFAYRDRGFEEKAKQDMSLVYLYTPKIKSEEPVWVSLEIASARSSLHRWEVCLISYPLSKGYQPKVTQIELKDIKLNENPPVIGRYFAFTYTKTNEIQTVLYWYETAVFTVNQTSQQKNMKISLIAYPSSLEDLPKVEDQLTRLARSIVNYWQPVKIWSQITMAIAQNGITLVAANTVILLALTVTYIFELKTQINANTSAYKKLSKINQQTVDAVKKAEEKSTIATLKNVREAYKEITGEDAEETHILSRLMELEKMGIIKRLVANRNDEPIQVWRAQIR